ncbi:hypothetical protein SBA3_3380003 [Candidatus Sulfopaludibacter sp. SbA3]|nr:hypothetical protein SBA3_3380003 [Candidatus Sulfopaludibacter sp. SbA3]
MFAVCGFILGSLNTLREVVSELGLEGHNAQWRSADPDKQRDSRTRLW